eukprot:scaffold68307_cov45-Phaeocystis_antarctica.AAC.1
MSRSASASSAERCSASSAALSDGHARSQPGEEAPRFSLPPSSAARSPRSHESTTGKSTASRASAPPLPPPAAAAAAGGRGSRSAIASSARIRSLSALIASSHAGAPSPPRGSPGSP